jgi:hypothetical protein
LVPKGGGGCRGSEACLQCWIVVAEAEGTGLHSRGRGALQAPEAGPSFLFQSELGRGVGRFGSGCWHGEGGGGICVG